MKAKYSKRVREEAALICAIAASGGVYRERAERRSRVYSDVREAIGASSKGLELAMSAYRASVPWPWTVESDALAEALIRSGVVR